MHTQHRHPRYTLTHAAIAPSLSSTGPPTPRIIQFRSMSPPRSPPQVEEVCYRTCRQSSSSSYRSRSPEWDNTSERSRSASPQSASRPPKKVHFVDGGTLDTPRRSSSVKSYPPSSSSLSDGGLSRRSSTSSTRSRRGSKEYGLGNGWEYVSSRGKGYLNEREVSQVWYSRDAVVVVEKASVLEREGRQRRKEGRW